MKIICLPIVFGKNIFQVKLRPMWEIYIFYILRVLRKMQVARKSGTKFHRTNFLRYQHNLYFVRICSYNWILLGTQFQNNLICNFVKVSKNSGCPVEVATSAWPILNNQWFPRVYFPTNLKYVCTRARIYYLLWVNIFRVDPTWTVFA